MDSQRSEAACLAAEQQLDYEFLPGTELLADVTGLRQVHASNHDQGVVLVPQPTALLHDPLNWSKKWKTIVILNQAAFVFIGQFATLSIGPLTPIFIAQFNKTVPQIALLTGVVVLALGYTNLLIIPCANVFGRRTTLLVCAFIVFGSNIWQATATSYRSFFGARVLNGIGVAANESVMTMVITDMFFLHERGTFVGLYFWCYFTGATVGPVLSGTIGQHVSWRWWFWVCTIVQAINIITLIFTFPETWRTDSTWASSSRGSVPLSSPSETSPVETKLPVDDDTEQRLEHIPTATPIDETVGEGRPCRAQFRMLQPINYAAVKTITRHVFTPFELLLYPIVHWASWVMGMASLPVLAVNLIQSPSLSGPPYNFSPQNVGFATFAISAGAAIGLLTGGPLSDWIAMGATKRNNGIREPEMRLVALVPFIFITAVGMSVIAVGTQNGWPWEAVVLFGYTCTGILAVGLSSIAVAYAVDCYKPIAGQIMTTATIVKNSMGFGMSYWLNPWIISSGYIKPLMLLSGLTIGFSLLGLCIMWPFGKTLRRWTRNAKFHSWQD